MDTEFEVKVQKYWLQDLYFKLTFEQRNMNKKTAE